MTRLENREEESRSLVGRLARVDANLIATWLLGFGLTLFLALEGGGYDGVVRGQAGIVVWWMLVVGVMVGALPIRKPGMPALMAVAVLTAFTLWTATSLIWTESAERTANELARAMTYLGVFVMALMVRGRGGTRRMANAVGSSIAVVSVLALVSRLQPSLIPEANQVAQFLDGGTSRLSYPLNYWNGLAELIAIGLPLMLFIATTARSRFLRAASEGLMPAMGLALFFTFSRTGSIAVIAGLLVFVALSNDRFPKVLALVLATVGAGFLIAVASSKNALEAGYSGPIASDQGDALLMLVFVTCLVVGASHAFFDWVLHEKPRPGFLRVSSGRARSASLGALAALLTLISFFVISGRASQSWNSFKSVESPGESAVRLSSTSGNGRYQLWESAIQQFSSAPLTGTGSGTFEFWWAREGEIASFVRDTHSLPLQTLGELGLPGLVILAGFFGLVLFVGVQRALGAARDHKAQLAAALGASTAFLLAVLVDWPWQIAVIPTTFLLVASTLLTAGDQTKPVFLSWAARGGVASIGVLAILIIAIPLASTSAVRSSQTEALNGELDSALDSARTARHIQPSASTPYLQEALVLEMLGRFAPASDAAREAAEREPTNWRPWFVLARTEARLGRVGSSMAAFEKLQELNPRSRFIEDLQPRRTLRSNSTPLRR